MLIFHHGSDTYRMRQAGIALAERMGAGHPGMLRNATVDLREPTGTDELERLLKYPTFFSEPTLITVTSALADARTAERMTDILDRYDPARMTDVTVVVRHEGESDGRSAAAKSLLAYLTKKSSEHTEFEPLKGAALDAWVTDFCVRRGCTIAPAALALVTQRTAGDGWALAQELEKLCAYAQNGAIDAHAIHALVAPPPERDEWELSNALAAQDKRGAIGALWRRLSQGTAEQLLLGSLASGIRTLMTVKDLAGRGLSPAAVAKTAGLHPYVVTKTLRGAASYTGEQLAGAHERLAGLDRSAKSGHADMTDGLFAVLLSL